MTRARTVRRRYMPPPIAGVDLTIPTGALPVTHAAFMSNFNVENGRLVKRKPHSSLYSSVLYQEEDMAAFAYKGLGVMIGDNWTQQAVTNYSLPNRTTTPTNIDPTLFDYTIYKGYVIAPEVTAGSISCQNFIPSICVWSAGLSLTGASAGKNGICVHRERIYITSGSTLYYGGVGATSGATTTFDLSGVMEGRVEVCESLGFSGGQSFEQLLVLASDRGDVTVWSGAYPGASDWSLIQKFSVPVKFQNDNTNFSLEIVKLPNDVLICTRGDYGVYSVREALTQGKAFQFQPCKFLKSIYNSNYRDGNVWYGSDYMFIKTTCYWQHRNALVVNARIDAANLSFFADWEDHFVINDTFDDPHKVMNVLFLIDLDDGHVEIHSIPPQEAGQFTVSPIMQIRCTDDYVIQPVNYGALRLFDNEVPAAITQDYGQSAGNEVDIKAIVALSPLNDLGYKVKAIKSLMLYSNVHSSHIVKSGIRPNFQTGPVDNYDTLDSTIADTTLKSNLLSGNEINTAPIISITEDGTHTAPFEFHGMDIIYEEGGEY